MHKNNATSWRLTLRRDESGNRGNRDLGSTGWDTGGQRRTLPKHAVCFKIDALPRRNDACIRAIGTHESRVREELRIDAAHHTVVVACGETGRRQGQGGALSAWRKRGLNLFEPSDCTDGAGRV